MGFISNEQIIELKSKITSDPSLLRKLYKSKKSVDFKISVDHNLVEGYEKDGWEIDSVLKTKTKLKKEKSHSKKYEDEVWCQFYELGFKTMNIDENFELPFSKDPNDKKQIDVIAVNDETAIIIECKSSVKLKKAPSYKDEFDLLSLRLDGFNKVLKQLFNNSIRTKFIFATNNLRIDPGSVDMERFFNTNSYHHNDSSFQYVNSIIKNYKKAATYQFMGLLFKGQLINSEKIEIPAVEGDMGGLKYYMFSIEPGILLKMGFVLHRTKANEEDMPTYQRLLVPSRLKGITSFIDGPDGNGGGFFPNSIIVNFNTKKHKIVFEGGAKSSSSNSRFGMLKLPNAYSIAYIIDGQHRLYGYANSKFRDSNTIPVVAFSNLPSITQLEMFMNINQNQKAVSPSLRLTLEEDLFWDSDRADSRIKALRSSIIKSLCISQSSPLLNKISIGEDTAELAFKPFATALSTSGLLPSAKGNKYSDKNLIECLYDTNNNNHDQEMKRSKKEICKLLELTYSFVEDNYSSIFEKDRYFILSNRGTYAFINIVGSLNSFLTQEGHLNKKNKPQERLDQMEKYLVVLLNGINTIDKQREESLLSLIGAGADVKWLRFFQELINSKFPNYNPTELIEWKERHNSELQSEGRNYGIAIEEHMKTKVLENIQLLFGDNWELEINSIKRDCQDRAEKDMERYYKEFNQKKVVEWTEMFNVNDYKTIIEKYWTNKNENTSFITFENLFSLDIGLGFNSKKEKTKWIAMFNSLRNNWAHEASKNDGLSKEEVALLKIMYSHCNKTSYNNVYSA
jgi:DNA sulfur modification protein DndB